MTNLEVEAQNIVNDKDGYNSDDVEVNDDAKYQAMLDKRKARRTVRTLVVQ